MPYTIQEEKTYQTSIGTLTTAILGAVDGLEGKLTKNDPASGMIIAKFNKTILGNFLGDRTQLEVYLSSLPSDETKMSMTIYPINPIGQKLEFGGRKGVARKVLTWFIAHVEHRLK
ncbi:MAG: hypothetical protein K0B06_01200 [Brevefilum sp.]|nr:hypothetical protein [Brevefilum sp.]